MRLLFAAVAAFTLSASFAAPVGAYSGAPVSVAPLPSGEVLVATYVNLDRYNAELTRREPVKPVFPQGIPDRWNPTGVSQYGGKVYVANYSGNNVLKGTLTGGEFRVEHVITNPAMKSPENVAVNADGIAVADYDSGAVHYFEHDGRLRWTYKLPLAHGVAIAYGHVYGASLSSEGLVKLEPATGAVVARNKTYGQKGFIYPTAMFSTKDSPFKGDLVVIDANRGAVIFIDRDLQIADQYGRNSRHLWLRPYGAEIIGARMLVADTENFRLVWLTASYEVTSAFDDVGKIHVGRAKEVGMDGRQCGYESLGPLPGLPRDMRFHAGWQGACGVVDNQAQGLSVVFPAYGQLGKRPPQFFNQLWRGIVEHKGTTYSVVGSPSRSVYMVVRGDDYIFVQLDPRITIWGPEGADGELSEIAEKAQTEFALFDGYKERCGTMSAILTYGEFKGTLAEAMDRVLLYPSAKEIARKWTAGEAVTDAAVTDYIRRTVNGSYVSIDDIALLRSMVGYRFDDMARHFQACQ